MLKKTHIDTLERVYLLTQKSKLHRFLNYPFRLLIAFLFRNIIFPLRRKAWIVSITTFFGKKMFVKFPAGNDLFIFGVKTHFSEIQLTKLLIKKLKPDNIFVDVGAHFGYFSLLASHLVGEKGKVYSFEPTASTFEILAKNISGHSNITAENIAIGEVNGEMEFYEFTTKYSENNTLNPASFKKQRWFKKEIEKITKIKVFTLDDLLLDRDILPAIIKVDVEGAEDKVVRGMKKLLEKHNPLVVLEFWNDLNADKSGHAKAIAVLKEMNYKSYLIREGELVLCESLQEYFIKNNVDSDNIAFLKS